MSASREKKIRQDLAASGVVDPKVIRKAEEAAKQRKSNILYGYIVPEYEMLHTQSKEYIVDDILEYMNELGVSV